MTGDIPAPSFPDGMKSLGKVLADSRKVKEEARKVIERHGLSPLDVAYVAGDFLHSLSSGFIQQVYGGWANGGKDYDRDFRRVVQAVKATGFHPAKGTALVVAWAMRALQDVDVGVGGGKQ